MSVVIYIDGEGEYHSFNLDKELWYTWLYEQKDFTTYKTFFVRDIIKEKFRPIRFCCKLKKK
jgi:hypothetical protein